MAQIKLEFIQKIKPDPFCNDIPIRVSPPPRQYPTFPLPRPPNCPTCGRTSRNRKNVIARNNNGNVGRPYYVCDPCEVTRGRVWITWDDWRGVYADNPECDCGLVSRRDRAGAKRGSGGCEFWKCAIGKCGYWERIEIEEQICEDAEKTEGTVRVKIKKE